MIRDERNKLDEFLNDAPIGFYSVDAEAAFYSSIKPSQNGWVARRPKLSAATHGCTIFWRYGRPPIPHGGIRSAARRRLDSAAKPR